MVLNIIEYPIDSTLGKFPPGTRLTDKLIGILGIDCIAGIACQGGRYTSGFSVTDNTIDFGEVLTTGDGDTFQLILRHPLKLDKNNV